MLFERRGPKLPYDAEVEYLESTGTQWIDTGVQPTADVGIMLDLDVTYAPNDLGGICGATSTDLFARGRSYSLYAGRSDNEKITVYDYCFGTTVRFRNHVIPYGVRTLHSLNWMKDNQCNVAGFIDGWQLDSPVGFVPYNITIMHLNVADNASDNRFYIKGKLYGAKLSLGTTVIQDMIPVRFTNELGQSEGAMYDRVSGQLFRNQGTGAFIVGPDKTANSDGGGYKCVEYSPLSFSRFSRLWKEAA